VEDLQLNFAEYPGNYITGINMYTSYPQSLDWCINECHNNATCRFLEYRADSMWCSGGSVEISSVVNDLSKWRSSPLFILYVKTCA
jgi:hypothetical protein